MFFDRPSGLNNGTMEISTSDNIVARAVASLLRDHGVKDVVMSPGSRNAPLITAVRAIDEFAVRMVVDERSAAFVALGIAITVRRPVALICTSGTALYNYAPAVAEAFYRRVPLIVVSADRPPEWIGQDDSQTLVQPGALANIVKRTYALPALGRDGDLWCAVRMLNDAMLRATALPAGPVHINVPIDEPLSGLVSLDEAMLTDHFPVVESVSATPDLSTARYRMLATSLASPQRVMIVAGFMPADSMVRKAVARLAAIGNIAVLAENTSNLWGTEGVIGNIDATLAAMRGRGDDFEAEMVPDIVVSVGGALVSRHLKQFLRRHSDRIIHWQVGVTDGLVDCFRSLSKSIDVEPGFFLRGIASGLQVHLTPSTYGRRWQALSADADAATSRYASDLPWCDFRLFAAVAPRIPRQWNLHFSNGTAIRYGQLFTALRPHAVECNRGVSGIDGSTSTALGASLAYGRAPTLLITGDMSALYDVGALFSPLVTPRLKVLLVDNGGGAIFRFIASTRHLPSLDDSFALGCTTPFDEVGRVLGFAVEEVSSEEELRRKWPRFAAECECPAMLVAHTDGALSASLLDKFFTALESRQTQQPSRHK